MITEQDWYILKNNEKLGPYSYKNMITLLQTNQLMEYDYVWKASLTAWTPIYQIDDFNSHKIQLLIQTDSTFSEAFKKRLYPRKSVNLNVLGHNEEYFFDGLMTSISKMGALCLLNTPLLYVGQKIKLHIKADEKPFNLEAEIIRKKISKLRLNSKSGLYYIIRFLEISDTGQDFVAKNMTELNSINL